MSLCRGSGGAKAGPASASIRGSAGSGEGPPTVGRSLDGIGGMGHRPKELHPRGDGDCSDGRRRDHDCIGESEMLEAAVAIGPLSSVHQPN